MRIDPEVYDLTETQVKIARPPSYRPAPTSAPEPDPNNQTTSSQGVLTIHFTVHFRQPQMPSIEG